MRTKNQELKIKNNTYKLRLNFNSKKKPESVKKFKIEQKNISIMNKSERILVLSKNISQKKINERSRNKN